MCLRNCFKMGQIMVFWFWQRLCRTRQVLWLWNEFRTGTQQRELAVCRRRRESKMVIPGKLTRNSFTANVSLKNVSSWRFPFLSPPRIFINLDGHTRLVTSSSEWPM